KLGDQGKACISTPRHAIISIHYNQTRSHEIAMSFSLLSHRVTTFETPAPAGARLFSHWWMRAGLIFILFTLVGLFEAGQSLMLQSVYGRSMAAWRSLLMGVLDWYIWALLTPLVVSAVHTFPIEQRYWPGRLLLHVFLSFVLSVVVIVFFTPLLQLV